MGWDLTETDMGWEVTDMWWDLANMGWDFTK